MDLRDIKKKRLEELQKKIFEQQIQEQQKSFQEETEVQQQIEALENIAKQYMTKEAISRYYNLKTAHPEKAFQVTAIIAEAIRTGNIKEKITDQQLKELLIEIQQPKKEFRMQKK